MKKEKGRADTFFLPAGKEKEHSTHLWGKGDRTWFFDERAEIGLERES